MYRPNARARKTEFWEELRGCVAEPNTPWIICGDFNAIFALEDKASGIPYLEDLRQASMFIYDLGLGSHLRWEGVLPGIMVRWTRFGSNWIASLLTMLGRITFLE